MSKDDFIVPITLALAVQAIQCGDIVVFPTETYFAIGGDATNPAVVDKVFAAKSRVYDNPLPLVLSNADSVSLVAGSLSPLTRRLMHDYWPGSVSILVPALPALPPALSGGSGMVAVRVSPHPVAKALCEACGVPVIASSANISGHPPVACANRLDPDLVAHTAGVIVDGPEPAGGMPSTIVRTVYQTGREVVKILRSGAVCAADFTRKGYVLL